MTSGAFPMGKGFLRPFFPVFLWAAVAAFIPLSGCSIRSVALHETVRIMENGIPAFEKDADIDMVRQALPSHIKLLEVVLESAAEDPKLLVMLSRLQATHAFLSLEGPYEKAMALKGRTPTELKTRMDRVYEKGAGYALRALETKLPGCTHQMDRMDTLEKCLGAMDRGSAEALFWYAYHLGSRVNVNRDAIRMLSKGPLAEKMMQRVIELDPGCFYGGAHLFLMAYHGSRTPASGGDPVRADRHYQALKEIAGSDFLLGDVFFARQVLIARGERQAFEKTLNTVLEAPLVQNARPALMNALAKERAALYLSLTDRWFE